MTVETCEMGRRDLEGNEVECGRGLRLKWGSTRYVTL